MRWLDTIEQQAYSRIPPELVGYFARGSAAELSLREQSEAWDSYRLRPHVLRNVSAVETGTEVLGTPVATPVLAAPTTLQRMAHPGAEVATAAGTAAAGSLLVVSTNAGLPFADLGGTAAWWVQTYVTRDRALTADAVALAARHGARAIVLTADTPMVGTSDAGDPVWDLVDPAQIMVNFDAQRLPAAARSKAREKEPNLTERDIGWLAGSCGLPVLIKGVLRGDDAARAVAAGAAGVIVSTHGGRQLDGVIPSARALPEVVDALQGTGAQVLVDGGIRRGRHVLIALALGARAVLVGRPALWGLTVGGAEGVRRVFDDLTSELAEAMTLCGVTSTAELARDLLACR